MRFNISERKKERWHPYFALFPIRVGENDVRWLEWIERRSLGRDAILGQYWTYRQKR